MLGGGVQFSSPFLLYIHISPPLRMCIAANVSIYRISVGYEPGLLCRRVHIHTTTAMQPLADLNSI